MCQLEALGVSMSAKGQSSSTSYFFLGKQPRQTGVALNVVLAEDGCVGDQPVGGTGTLLGSLTRGAVGMQPGQDDSQAPHHFRSLFIVEDLIDCDLRLFKEIPNFIVLSLVKPKVCYRHYGNCAGIRSLYLASGGQRLRSRFARLRSHSRFRQRLGN